MCNQILLLMVLAARARKLYTTFRFDRNFRFMTEDAWISEHLAFRLGKLSFSRIMTLPIRTKKMMRKKTWSYCRPQILETENEVHHTHQPLSLNGWEPSGNTRITLYMWACRHGLIFFLSYMLITGNRTQSACLLQETHLQLQWPRK